MAFNTTEAGVKDNVLGTLNVTLQKPRKSVIEPPILRLRCREDGPLVVELTKAVDGTSSVTVQVTDYHRMAFILPTHKSVLALYRCGKSANRPFCNGAEKLVNFA